MNIAKITLPLTALTLTAAAVRAQGAYEDRLVRSLQAQGFLRASLLADLDADGAVDSVVSSANLSKVWIQDGFDGTTSLLQGPGGTGFGGLVEAADFVAGGGLELAVFSTQFGSEWLSIFDANGASLGGSALPSGHNAPTWACAIQADGDADMELVYGTPSYMSGLGLVGLYDPGTNAFSTLATGTTPGEAFAVRGAVVDVPGQGVRVAVCAPDSPTDALWLFDLAGNGQSLGAPAAAAGVGRNGIQQTGSDELTLLSGDPSFYPQPNGRIDQVQPSTGSWSVFDQGAPGVAFTSINEPDDSGEWFYSERTVGQHERVYRVGLGSVVPDLRIQAVDGTDLKLVRRPRGRIFDGMPEDYLGVVRGNVRTLDVYKERGDELDVRVEELQAISNSGTDVYYNFGPGRAGGYVFPCLSWSRPTTTVIAALGIELGLTPDSITVPSLTAFPGAPVMLDGQGRAVFHFDVPQLGWGGFIQPTAYGGLGFEPSGQLFASRDAASGNWTVL